MARVGDVTIDVVHGEGDVVGSVANVVAVAVDVGSVPGVAVVVVMIVVIGVVVVAIDGVAAGMVGSDLKTAESLTIGLNVVG